MDRKKIIYGVVVMLFSSCNDMFLDKKKCVIGNLCILNLHGNSNGNELCLRMGNGNYQPLIPQIKPQSIDANDTILLLKALKANSELDTFYYMIAHEKGIKVKEVISLDFQEYSLLIKENYPNHWDNK